MAGPQAHKSCLNAVASKNISVIFVTDATAIDETSLLKLLARRNICPIVVTLSVPVKIALSKEVALSNIDLIVVTSPTAHVEMSWLKEVAK